MQRHAWSAGLAASNSGDMLKLALSAKAWRATALNATGLGHVECSCVLLSLPVQHPFAPIVSTAFVRLHFVGVIFAVSLLTGQHVAPREVALSSGRSSTPGCASRCLRHPIQVLLGILSLTSQCVSLCRNTCVWLLSCCDCTPMNSCLG